MTQTQRQNLYLTVKSAQDDLFFLDCKGIHKVVFLPKLKPICLPSLPFHYPQIFYNLSKMWDFF